MSDMREGAMSSAGFKSRWTRPDSSSMGALMYNLSEGVEGPYVLLLKSKCDVF